MIIASENKKEDAFIKKLLELVDEHCSSEEAPSFRTYDFEEVLSYTFWSKRDAKGEFPNLPDDIAIETILKADKSLNDHGANGHWDIIDYARNEILSERNLPTDKEYWDFEGCDCPFAPSLEYVESCKGCYITDEYDFPDDVCIRKAYLAKNPVCPLGGDTANDCADCAYSPDYKYEDGECVER